jgi:hypothetical protein
VQYKAPVQTGYQTFKKTVMSYNLDRDLFKPGTTLHSGIMPMMCRAQDLPKMAMVWCRVIPADGRASCRARSQQTNCQIYRSMDAVLYHHNDLGLRRRLPLRI